MSYYRHVPNKIKKTFCGKLESFGHSLLFWDMSDLAISFLDFCFRNKVDGISCASHFYNYVHPNTLHALVPFCLTRESKNDNFLDYDVIARSVSQNCGRQPHIVSTNHSNLIAVGPNRSLASRQAIVWTYRPRVETTESQPPDFLRSESLDRPGRKANASSLRFSIFNFQFLEFKQEVAEARIVFK